MTDKPANQAGRIRVKLLSPIPDKYFLHQLPQGNPEWGHCRFSFDPEDRHYDWLVVYEDLRTANKDGKRGLQELLACPHQHTLLVTSEPSSIKHYGNAYIRQFGCVLTSQEQWALPHPDRIFSQAGLIWIYGVGSKSAVSFDQMLAHPPAGKSKDISMVFSPKRMRHTLHHRRFTFMQKMMQSLPELDIYGQGAIPLDDKAEALDAYRYHIAIENYIGPHHWTEKLADAFLGLTLPFYAGCPNAADYFPPESFIPIDMNDPEGAVKIIRQAISNNEYEKRLPAIIEARRRILFEHNLFAVLSREIEKRHKPGLPSNGNEVIYSRHALRKQSPLAGLRDMYGKARSRAIHLIRHR
jgi:hypothetical protein